MRLSDKFVTVTNIQERAHKLAAYLAGMMDVAWLDRAYPREEYIQDDEWKDVGGQVFDCVVVHSDDDRPETVTIDGRQLE